MTQSIRTQLIISGVANGSGFTSQQPTVIFEHLPYSRWHTLTTPYEAVGRAIGFANPAAYKLALFATENRDAYLGDRAWLVDIADDGSFSMQVGQAAPVYVALLMSPSFAERYFADTFPDGSGITTQLPSPAEHPGEVLLMLEMPAGLDRSIVFPDYQFGIPLLAPGHDWMNEFGSGPTRSIQPAPLDAPNPMHLTDESARTLWNMLYGKAPSTYTLSICSQSPDGRQGRGAIAMGVYAYGDKMYMIAGGGPRYLDDSVTPVIVASPLLEWGPYPPSFVLLSMNVTVLPERLMVGIDVLDVEPSLLYEFIKLLYKVEKALLSLLFDEI